MLSTRGYPERDGDGEGLGLKYSSSWMIYVHNIHTNIHNIHNYIMVRFELGLLINLYDLVKAFVFPRIFPVDLVNTYGK